MKPTRPMRGVIGMWLRRALDERGWTANDLQRELELEGYSVSTGFIYQWLNGTARIPADKLTIVEAVLGRPAPAEPDPDVLVLAERIGELSEALRAQSAMIGALVAGLPRLAAEAAAQGAADALVEAAAVPGTAGSLDGPRDELPSRSAGR